MDKFASSLNVVAIHEVDLEKALRRLDIYQKIINGTMNCMICEEPVSMENLEALMRVNGKIKLSVINHHVFNGCKNE